MPAPSPLSPLTQARIGVVGATGAVGRVTLDLLAERGCEQVRAFSSSRSAGGRVPFAGGELPLEEATPEALSAGDVGLFLFSVGTEVSRALVPHAVSGGALVVDKSSAYRLVDGYPLVVPEVNGTRALEALEGGRVVANPNCCAIPLSSVLAPLAEAAGLARVRVATYQSVSGAGEEAMARLRSESAADHDLRMDWEFDGVEFDEEVKLREETRKILELPGLALSATCVRVPVLVGHAEAVWVETAEPLQLKQARDLLGARPGLRLVEAPSPGQASGLDEILVGRLRQDEQSDELALFIACDNLRKGAALNAIQIAELLLAAPNTI